MTARVSPRSIALAFAALLGAGCVSTIDQPGDGVREATLQPSPYFAGDPANGAVFAIDLSVWEGPMSQAEMDCFFASGVRHVVVGTQLEEVAQQQVAMAASRGMTVDGYVYLYWDVDMGTQLERAFAQLQGFPIGRMWLDVEQSPGSLGANQLIPLLEQAVAACRAHAGVECGIYTGPGFWHDALGSTTKFADLPLWYALYNHETSLSDWSVEHFGGWAKPVGKQWSVDPLCGDGLDDDVLQVVGPPPKVVDRSAPPDDGLPPPAPVGLYPADGSTVTIDLAKLMVLTAPNASQYRLSLETWSGSSFVPYYTWTSGVPFQKTYPPRDHLYRFSARAGNAHGWSAASNPSTFVYGSYSGSWPKQQPLPDAGAPPPPDLGMAAKPDLGMAAKPDLGMAAKPDLATPPPPADAGAPLDAAGEGAPTGLSPDGVTLTSASVTLSCQPVGGASSYTFAVSTDSGNGLQPYFSYTSAAPSKTFWPQLHGTTYHFRVSAVSGGVAGPWSSDASFVYP